MKQKCGVIYILTNPSFSEYVKIGYADDVDARVKQLNNSESVPFSFHIYATFDVMERLTDKKLHNFIDTLNPELRSKEKNVRVFDDTVKRVVYEKQTQDAKNKGISNCPLCALGNDSNKVRIWELKELEAYHVTAWSKGGSTEIDNCQMLCQTHNRAK